MIIVKKIRDSSNMTKNKKSLDKSEEEITLASTYTI